MGVTSTVALATITHLRQSATAYRRPLHRRQQRADRQVDTRHACELAHVQERARLLALRLARLLQRATDTAQALRATRPRPSEDVRQRRPRARRLGGRVRARVGGICAHIHHVECVNGGDDGGAPGLRVGGKHDVNVIQAA
eukprot:CAMPEP_0119425368 /NCGR_PEP_ID=MMETSP1335-20130426/34384_1 /TAXON_ID=259385 /ORGANISM="Chrysoculter rhomboideus, Strain RCC1486" /LENGTH=140 /DNA_ID=CAMNT_0007450933 /DNA_START=76 /DNA_END=494 /DNA_ORIENTATION=+